MIFWYKQLCSKLTPFYIHEKEQEIIVPKWWWHWIFLVVVVRHLTGITTLQSVVFSVKLIAATTVKSVPTQEDLGCTDGSSVFTDWKGQNKMLQWCSAMIWYMPNTQLIIKKEGSGDFCLSDLQCDHPHTGGIGWTIQVCQWMADVSILCYTSTGLFCALVSSILFLDH